jgi:hypothetical protein
MVDVAGEDARAPRHNLGCGRVVISRDTITRHRL